MERKMIWEQLLAAEVYNYNYADYRDHLGINGRFDRIMPQVISTLERTEREYITPLSQKRT